jgi:hypothetical protein
MYVYLNPHIVDMSVSQLLWCLLRHMDAAVAINLWQWILLLNFYHTLLWFLPEDGGRSVKHVAEIKKLYLYVHCMCKGWIFFTNVI